MLKGPNQLDGRVPVEVGGIQVNFCKNPQCQNFGVPAGTQRQPRGKGAEERDRDTYSVVGSGRGTPMLRCSFCGQYPMIKSNKAIHEELSRFGKPFDTIAILTCPNQDCPNHYIDTEQGKTHYHSFGRTKSRIYTLSLQGVRQNIHYRFTADDPAPKAPQKCCYFPSSRQQGAFPSHLRG